MTIPTKMMAAGDGHCLVPGYDEQPGGHAGVGGAEGWVLIK